MCDSPDPLQKICIDFVSTRRSIVFNPLRDLNGNVLKYEWKDDLVCLPARISEALLCSLDQLTMTDCKLSILDAQCTRLNRVCIRDASFLSAKGLRVLRPHHITELTAISLFAATINDLIGCLGEWTLKNLQLLNVSRGTFGGSEKVRVVVALSKLKKLRSLDVSFTELNSQGLKMIAADLRELEQLNIAGTQITDVAPVVAWRDTLRSLNLYNIRLSQQEALLQVLGQLRHLQHLDISDDCEEPQMAGGNPDQASLDFTDFLEVLAELPELVSLDLSGKKGVDAACLKSFLASHRQMRFLGLMENDVCQDDAFCRESDPLFNPRLEVTGFATEKQVLASLRRYLRRKVFIHKSLCYLYTDIQSLSEVRVDIIRLVLQAMEYYPKVAGVQIASTACLYCLSKGPLASALHPSVLGRIIDNTLVSMESFPAQFRLQKNALLTLCSDRMLQDVSFDRYRCAELAMKSLMNFEDPAMNRMAVAICSILASRISTVETSNLGAKTDYMIRLLDIVKGKAEVAENDIMMKFTLSALWNLTDESPRTCSVFLEQGGLQLFLDVLNKFAGESSVETKILGLMNNLAEVKALREDLMKNNLIDTLRLLLRSQHIDVSYFAAGIVAHLASEGEAFWVARDRPDWADMVQELGSAVSRWAIPPTEMVAYRSFKPFYSLFNYFDAFQVQLWAAWAVHHVCFKNPKRYCKMLVKEEGVEVLGTLLEKPNFHNSVANLCLEILQFVKREFPRTVIPPQAARLYQPPVSSIIEQG